MHGGIIYFANDSLTEKIYHLAKHIVENYDSYKFRYFVKPADEPILALSMAVNNCLPIDWGGEAKFAYCFYPTVKVARFNIVTGMLAYTRDGVNWMSGVKLMHWQNYYTHLPMYQREVDRMKYKNTGIILILYVVHSITYQIKRFFNRAINAINWST